VSSVEVSGKGVVAQVRDYTVRRAAEHERWLAGMRKLQRRVDQPEPEEQ
jgi:hypothetical protein